MKHIYTFAEVDGSRLAATADRDGANLPGSPQLWRRLDKLDVEEMIGSSGITAMGNAEEILRDVRDHGLYLTPSQSV
ncbi:hypothetical protein MKL09_31395 [Methylobacterium sp. J-048]|uniref:hypothetical protein n=1 Tax=unclassified Methylobacterium TaxID=2615210 RepID=UPI001FBA11F5|nr:MULTISPECIES: hypothetical protein [unclassified Methylobacterium]MCJ2061012.1 hypothetical protein [Methylobacterium sp. J-048]MCJ2124070.1 hypothetical protein [Methylobacterium sp. J-077]